MKIIDGDKTECDRCDAVQPLAEVSLLEKRDNKQYEKILCEQCLAAVGVPNGYTLERDITYLAR